MQTRRPKLTVAALLPAGPEWMVGSCRLVLQSVPRWLLAPHKTEYFPRFQSGRDPYLSLAPLHSPTQPRHNQRCGAVTSSWQLRPLTCDPNHNQLLTFRHATDNTRPDIVFPLVSAGCTVSPGPVPRPPDSAPHRSLPTAAPHRPYQTTWFAHTRPFRSYFTQQQCSPKARPKP